MSLAPYNLQKGVAEVTSQQPYYDQTTKLLVLSSSVRICFPGGDQVWSPGVSLSLEVKIGGDICENSSTTHQVRIHDCRNTQEIKGTTHTVPMPTPDRP